MVFTIHQHESALSTHIFPSNSTPPPTSFPIQPLMSQSTGFGFPVPYNELSLAIYFTYGNISFHVFISLFGCAGS